MSTLQITRCPNPKGTDDGMRLYVVRGPRPATMALDAMPDDLGSGAGTAFEQLHEILRANLSPDDLGRAEGLLTHLLDATAPAADGADEPPMAAGGKERLNYVGSVESNPSRGYAADSAEVRRRIAAAALVRSGRAQAQNYEFHKRFPGAARIRTI